MNKKPSILALEKLRRLIESERQAEIAAYQETVKETPLLERRNKGICWYPVQITREEIGLGEKLFLEIERTSQQGEPHKFQEGQTAALFANLSSGKQENPSVHGVIDRVKRDTIRLVLNLDELPDWIDDGKLGLDLLYNESTFKSMKWALETVMEANANRLAELREILLGFAPPYFIKKEFNPKFPDLNDSQNEALQLIAAAKDVAIIHGPPGTGKTTTLVKAIFQTLKTEKQVLVCAPSNTAVDLLTAKLTSIGIKTLRIGHPARVDASLQEYSLDSHIANHTDYRQLKQLRKDAQKIRHKALKFKRHFGKEERQERRTLLQESRQVLQQARQLEDYILDNVLNEAQVITATLAGSDRPYMYKRQFTTVFIDEASQALEPACWIPITKSNRVVFAGDHCQLPPTVKTQAAQQEGLELSLFEKCIEKLEEASVMLRTQYRMHEQIMGFSATEFYYSQLQAHESVKNHTLGQELPILNIPFEYIDTAGCGFDEKQNPQTLSTANPQEAQLLLKYLTELVNAIELETGGLKDSFTLGIISPYKQQVLLLEDSLSDYSELQNRSSQISIDTVDGFQGQERDIIAISMVRSNDNGKIGFLSDIRRMNVAMTRARKKLIIIGDSATISTHPFYQRFLDYVEQNNAYRSAWEFV